MLSSRALSSRALGEHSGALNKGHLAKVLSSPRGESQRCIKSRVRGPSPFTSSARSQVRGQGNPPGLSQQTAQTTSPVGFASCKLSDALQERRKSRPEVPPTDVTTPRPLRPGRPSTGLAELPGPTGRILCPVVHPESLAPVFL